MVIDEEQFDFVKSKRWRLKEGYAVEICSSELNILHRMILGLKPNDGKIADHVNMNKLDNRKENLRIANHSQNMSNRNKFKRKDVTSKYKGVRYLKNNNYYQCRIQKDKKPYTIGHYYDEIACANMYNHIARKLHGDFCNINDVPYMSVEECEKYKVTRRNRNEETI